jgi:hypothetical protein
MTITPTSVIFSDSATQTQPTYIMKDKEKEKEPKKKDTKKTVTKSIPKGKANGK